MLTLYYILFAIKCKKTGRNSAGFRKKFIGSLFEGDMGAQRPPCVKGAAERSEAGGL